MHDMKSCAYFFDSRSRNKVRVGKALLRPCLVIRIAWWRHQMEAFSALLALCAGNSPVTGEFSSQRPVTRSFDVSFDLRLKKRLSKPPPPRHRWFETPSRPSWRHCNEKPPCWDQVPTHGLNTFRPRQNYRHFADDIFKCIFLNENVWISLKISLNYIPKVPINAILELVHIMAWRRPGDKSLSWAMMLTHICFTRLQWVNTC